MKTSIFIVAILTLLHASAFGAPTPASPLSPNDIDSLTKLEQTRSADAVTAGNFSTEIARQANFLQLATLATSLLALGGVATGAVYAWRRSAFKTILPATGAERRASRRFPMASNTSTITLHTPFGEIQADPVDISEGGMQIVMRGEHPTATSKHAVADRINISIHSLGACGVRLLDSMPCKICWARKDRLGLRFERTIPLESLFAQQIAVPVPV